MAAVIPVFGQGEAFFGKGDISYSCKGEHSERIPPAALTLRKAVEIPRAIVKEKLAGADHTGAASAFPDSAIVKAEDPVFPEALAGDPPDIGHYGDRGV